tara:strand:+ start:30516 stop:30656 length:141 start_codon:yes stop_codon:yes gene_type:complete
MLTNLQIYVRNFGLCIQRSINGAQSGRKIMITFFVGIDQKICSSEK